MIQVICITMQRVVLRGGYGVGWRTPGEIMGLVHRLEFEKGPGDERKPVLCVRFVIRAQRN